MRLNRALIFDENGEFMGMVKFKRTALKFNFHKRSFNIRRKNASFWRYRIMFGMLWVDYYFYSFNHSEPMFFKLDYEPAFPLELYQVMLDTKVGREINLLGGFDITGWVKQNWIFVVVILGLLGYGVWAILNGNKII